LFQHFEDLFARNGAAKPADDQMSGFAAMNPQFSMGRPGFFPPHQNQAPISFRLDGDNVACFNPGLFPGFGGNHHLAAFANYGVHGMNLAQTWLAGNAGFLETKNRLAGQVAATFMSRDGHLGVPRRLGDAIPQCGTAVTGW
jgi:hypothetical protein